MAEEKATATETKTEPTQAPEIKGTLLEAAETADWNQNLHIVEPNSVTEDGKTIEREPKTQTEPEIKEEVKEEVKAEAPAAQAEQVIEIDDPGEFSPKDYSFDVMVFDGEGKRGRSQKISSIDQWEQLLDTDPNFGSATALLKAERLANKMDIGTERDKSDYDAKKAEYDQAVETQQAREQATTNMVNEIAYLVDRGELPRVSTEYANADWSDPKVAAQPGVKEQIALLDYMASENARRTKAGLSPTTSLLDVWASYQLDEAKKTSQTQREQAAQARKDAGARVAGVAPNPVTAAPRGIMIGRGGSLDELSRGNWGV